ncbi:MAG: exodeoxyribonuclease V subunit alpha [Desulfobacteraceae bacterium]|jgi:exodeoxyribonuclease V alpha subunit
MTGLTTEEIGELRDKGLVGSIDLHFARLMEELGGGGRDLFLASALLSGQTRIGHICLDLREFSSRELVEKGGIRCPDHEGWLNILKGNAVVGAPGEQAPMILDGDSRLYLNRYFEYQRFLSEYILEKARVAMSRDLPSVSGLKERLDKLFGDSSSSMDHQKAAACLSYLNGFSVISGGPGTGKTTTVAKLLVLFIQSFLEEKNHDNGNNEKRSMSILLCAPTGKAAQRLKESLNTALDGMDIQENIRRLIPQDVLTIHRMLGTIPGSPYFRYNSENRLPADLVVVDEASMVDLALMSKLVSALSPHTSLVLLGDKDQLSSVEAGSVMGDICGSVYDNVYSTNMGQALEKYTGFSVETYSESVSGTGMENLITVLTRSYRFGEKSGIGKLSRAANQGDHGSVFSVLDNVELQDVNHEDLPVKLMLKDALRKRVCDTYGRYVRMGDIREAFIALEAFKILCAVREGTYGVNSVNRLVADILYEENLADTRDEWYPGRPVMITKNDYNLKLFNGDVGITVEDETNNLRCRVVFKGNDNQFKSFAPDQLPEYETAFAMTVHKSQGSEFDRILLILPERENPILTRELVYTGVTRARKHVTIMADREILARALERRIMRRSGLRDILWPKNLEFR